MIFYFGSPVFPNVPNAGMNMIAVEGFGFARESQIFARLRCGHVEGPAETEKPLHRRGMRRCGEV
jgi:hypothetical protein